MTTLARDWLIERASPSGMVACGMRRPNGQAISLSHEDGCSPEGVERILQQFEKDRPALLTVSEPPRWWTWSFEQAQIRLVPRPDGWLLGLVIRFPSEAASQMDALSDEFLRAPAFED